MRIMLVVYPMRYILVTRNRGIRILRNELNTHNIPGMFISRGIPHERAGKAPSCRYNALVLSVPIQELLGRIGNLRGKSEDASNGEEKPELIGIVTRAATFYEKVRYLVDYREEHTIRRSAIERIIRRKVTIEHGTPTAESLLKELEHSQYTLEEAMNDETVRQIDHILTTFLTLRSEAKVSPAGAKMLLSFAASEIDLAISPRRASIDAAVVDAFYKTMRQHISAPSFSTQEIDVQLYAACRRALVGSDNEMLAHALWLMYVPGWETRTPESLSDLLPRVPGITNAIARDLKNPLQWQLVRKLKNESIYFYVVRELISQHGEGARLILGNEKRLEEFTTQFLDKKYEKENLRIQSSGVRAVFYLFLTKVAVALAIEVPYELWYLHKLDYFPLAANALFHPLLLFVGTRGVGKLDEKNTEAIIASLKGIVIENKVRAVTVRGDRIAIDYLFGAIYLLLFWGVFSALVGLLSSLGFNAVGITLFVFFLALASYFTFRIRYNAQRWKVVHSERTISLIMSVLALPVIRAGRWLSRTFSTLNVFVLILDFVIETPFKLLLNFTNQFLIYLREKAEEIY